jgi:hypothetical protein
MDLTDKIIAFETGELSDRQVIELFAELVRTGVAWTLQGSYGRMARQLIVGGYIDANGNVLRQLPEE